MPCPAKQILTQIAAETLKAKGRDWASLLTTCSMSKTFFKCFLVY